MKDPVRARVAETRYGAVVKEIAAEKAASLGRAGRKLEEALDRLAAHPMDDSQRRRLLDEAGEMLYYYIVQREACGLYDAEEIFREFGAPPEVRRRMGLRAIRENDGSAPAA